MRTADSWLSVIHPAAHLGAEGELERQIERVQQDAYLAGLKKASEIAEAQKNMQFPKKHAVWNSMCSDMKVVILAEMERVKKEQAP